MTDEIHDDVETASEPGGEIPAEMLVTEAQRRATLIEHKRRKAKDDPRSAIFRKADQRHEAEVEDFCAANVEARAQQEQVREQAAGPRHKVTVYGVEQDMTEVTTQIERVDQQLGERERQLDEYARTLQAQANRLRETQQQPVEIDKAKLREAHAALLRGDDELSTELMAEAIATAKRPAPQPAGDPRVSRVNELFSQEFDPGNSLPDDAFYAAAGLMKARLANPANFGRSPESLVQEVARVLRLTGQPARAAEPVRTLKHSIPITTLPAEMRSPPPAPPAPTQTNSSYIESLRRRSGSNSTLQLRRD